MSSYLNKTISFMGLMETLKNELRHSWTSSGRQESVGEHSWRLALLIMTIHPHLSHPIDLQRALKMAIIHDCVEAIAGDIPVFDLVTQEDHDNKQAREEAAILHIASLLGDPTGNEIKTLWFEFEERKTYEAKVVYALDKLECKIQHNEADISTWNEREKALSIDWEDDLYDCDKTILELRDHIYKTSLKKVNAHPAHLPEDELV